MITYYCIFDRSLNLSNLPFAARDDDDAVSMVRNMLLSADRSILGRISDFCELRRCGVFDQKTSTFQSESGAFVVCALSDIPLPKSKEGDV